MLLSMTGYGRAERVWSDKSILIEIRSLNSKVTDLKLKFPPNYKERELHLRQLVVQRVERGKIDLLIDIKSLLGVEAYSINKVLFKKYYEEIKQLSTDLKLPKSDVTATILQLPGVVASPDQTVDEKEWEIVLEVVEDALKAFTQYRATEGKVLWDELLMRTKTIQQLVTQVMVHEPERAEKQRARLQQLLEENIGKERVDNNRFEQEMIFYLEKIDLTEEKVRLEQHCIYFIEQVKSTKETTKGRILSFISQEMGREINTMGAKAYSHDIQRLVVQMKDELEKIKEQIANLV
jgi:uncharacterized protein (TIGR00255 family)